jgi:hypothetical protein
MFVSTVKQVHGGARQQQQVRQNPEHMSGVFGDQEEHDDGQEPQ